MSPFRWAPFRKRARLFAAWLIARTGGITVRIAPTCGRCGHGFVVNFPDLAPIIAAAVRAEQMVSVGMQGPPPPTSGAPALFTQKGEHDGLRH
jgi:hypothetical protein